MGLKISESLIALRKLQEIDFDKPIKELQIRISNVNAAINNLQIINKNELMHLEDLLERTLVDYCDAIKKIEVKLDRYLYDDQSEYIKVSQGIWEENLEKMKFDENISWSSHWPPKTEEFKNFCNQIAMFTNWQYPGLIYGAKNSEIIEKLVGVDPFYIVERYVEYFNLQKKKFHPDFTRKMNCYKLDNLHLLPDNAIGLMVIYNELPFLPWNMIVEILHILISKLGDGGTIIFNYNDCTTVRGFKEFENRSMTYSTPEMYETLFKSYNMYCHKKYVSDIETFSYLIFKKDKTKELIKKYPSVGYILKQATFSNADQHKNKIDYIRNFVKSKNAE